MIDVMPIEQAEFIDNLQRWFSESTNMCHEDCYRFAFIVWQHKDYLSKVLGAEERAKVLDEFEQFYISYNERKCENCNDDSEYACFKCMMKKFKEQKEDNTRPFYANEWNS